MLPFRRVELFQIGRLIPFVGWDQILGTPIETGLCLFVAGMFAVIDPVLAADDKGRCTLLQVDGDGLMPIRAGVDVNGWVAHCSSLWFTDSGVMILFSRR